MNYLLSEAEEPIKEVLERLLEKDERLYPFAVIDKVGNPDLFVQFSTKGGVLYFDVPLIRITLEEVTPEEGAFRATTELISMGINPDERVLIHEHEDDPAKIWGEPIRRPKKNMIGKEHR